MKFGQRDSREGESSLAAAHDDSLECLGDFLVGIVGEMVYMYTERDGMRVFFFREKGGRVRLVALAIAQPMFL